MEPEVVADRRSVWNADPESHQTDRVRRFFLSYLHFFKRDIDRGVKKIKFNLVRCMRARVYVLLKYHKLSHRNNSKWREIDSQTQRGGVEKPLSGYRTCYHSLLPGLSPTCKDKGRISCKYLPIRCITIV